MKHGRIRLMRSGHAARDAAEAGVRTRSIGVLVALAAAFAGAIVLVTAAAALTPVDCDSPNDFCTGDPCTTSDQLEITVPSCVLDFGTRALVIAEVVRVPNNGFLSLTAASIEVRKRLDGKHVDSSAGDGSDIALHASGNIIIKRRLDVTARNTAGSILLDAIGNVDLRDQLRAAVKGHDATASGGNIDVTANGTVTSTASAKVDARGKKGDTAGGHIVLAGQAGVSLKGKVDARGTPGGGVTLASPAGSVLLQRELRLEGSGGSGGTVIFNAQGNVTTQDRVIANGAPGGTILVNAGGTLGGTRLRARGFLGLAGGTVAATVGAIDVARIETRGFSTGGAIDLTSTVGDVTVELLDARARTGGTGGTINVDSAADLTCERDALVEGDIGGEMRFSAAGNMVLGAHTSSDFDARGTPGGVVEGQATGNLTATGDFTAKTGGCIGLSAGGTLDTSQADFDVPLTASCP